MGFFSADCTRCGHPLLSEYASNPTNQWMEHGVTIFEDATLVRGRYDGYGRYLDETGAVVTEDAVFGTVWHDACWLADGSPTDYRGESASSADQGYFFDDGDHDLPAPVPAPANADVLPESDLPECMKPGWDPLTPGREAEARFLDACIREGVDPREVDPDGHWTS